MWVIETINEVKHFLHQTKAQRRVPTTFHEREQYLPDNTTLWQANFKQGGGLDILTTQVPA